jgi:hypothetical protein
MKQIQSSHLIPFIIYQFSKTHSTSTSKQKCFITNHRSYLIFHLSSFVFHLSSFIFHLSYFIFHLASLIFHISFFIFHFSYFIFHISYFIFHIQRIAHGMAYHIRHVTIDMFVITYHLSSSLTTYHLPLINVHMKLSTKHRKSSGPQINWS